VCNVGRAAGGGRTPCGIYAAPLLVPGTVQHTGGGGGGGGVRVYAGLGRISLILPTPSTQ
jgi:hypothetical protein